MDKKIETQEDLTNTLLNVRKAHRLLKEYQERILNSMFYIQNKFAMPEVRGERHFCNTFATYKSGDAKLKVWKDMWSWDFLYSYEFEFYFGEDYERLKNSAFMLEDETALKDGAFALSIFQISDTGFYKGKTEDGNDLTGFATVDESESLLMFVFSVKPKDEDWIWSEEFDKSKHQLIRKNEANYTVNKRFLAKTYPMEVLFNKETLDEALTEFNTTIKDFCGVELLKK